MSGMKNRSFALFGRAQFERGQGRLRDLNTLFWIARYSYQVEALDDLVGLGVLTARNCGCFENAMIFSGMCAAICIFSPIWRKSA